MKSIFLTLITFYQQFISPILHQLLGMQSACRYPQSCSSYAKETIEAHGIVRGGGMAIKRIVNCQPFTNAATFEKNVSK